MAKPELVIVAHDTAAALTLAIKKTSDAAYKTRLKAILKAKKGAKRATIATELVITERSVSLWLSAYNKGGVHALMTKQPGRRAGPQKWRADIFETLAKAIDKGGYWSVPRMQEWLKEHHHKDIPEQTVWYRMDQLNYSYKSARPHPVQGNKEKQDAFKKGASYRSWSH